MDPAQLSPGHRLDRYELLCPLAYGGMASVWLARFGGRRGFERLVVVKMILPQYSQDPRFQEMFLDEARIASRIEHANVARILDVGEQEENTFIVMEWVDGDSLSKVMRAAESKKQPVPAGIALRVCADAAAGLHAAHVLQERDGTPLGVVHRDVSPQNILIANTGSTVIIDFGVAKARDRVSQETSAGQLKGKIRYMAPEQALGRAIDHRADVWALGAILYELFAGVPPYDGPNEVATLHKLTSGTVPAPLPPHVPLAIRRVVDRALAYDSADRYATALELNLALETAMVEIGEATSIAVVAHYTAQLLADRKAARRRAVDAALASAQARDGGRDRPSTSAVAPSISGIAAPSSSPSVSSGPPAPSSLHRARTATPPYPMAPTDLDLASTPSGSVGHSDVPSATSSATLGSAAMEYPPELVDDPARKRRFVTAVILGVSLAAGVIGAVLIISTAVLKRSANEASTGAASQTAVTAAAATEAPPPPESEPAPAPAAAPLESPSATASASASASASAIAVSAPKPTTTAPPATHRPTPPPPATARPKPAAPTPPSPTGKDRGF
ncbi:MAG: serine/threonine protein kinase [Labilithrix sp.]|nr:serine/threonine protein kinase [Labilithrix sp.]